MHSGTISGEPMTHELILLVALGFGGQQPTSQPATQLPNTSLVESSVTTTEPVLIKKIDPVYPEEAKAAGIDGQAVIAFTVTEDGSVKDASRVSGDQRLVDAALSAVTQWKYQPAMRDGKPIEVRKQIALTFSFRTLWERKNPAPAHGGPTVRVRVSQAIAEAFLKNKEVPQYPKVARDANIQGTVVLHAIIDYDGNMRSLGLVSGPRELVEAAVDSVKNWRYKPYMLNGQPVQVDTLIPVRFFLVTY